MIRRAWNRVLAMFRRAPLDKRPRSRDRLPPRAAVEDNIRRGSCRRKRRAAQALVRFGGVARAREQHREARGLPALDVLRQDLRYAFRDPAARPCVRLRRHPRAGPRHRRERRGLQRCQHHPAPPASVPRVRTGWSGSPLTEAKAACPSKPTPSPRSRSSGATTGRSRT